MVSEQKYSQDVVLKVSVHFFAKWLPTCLDTKEVISLYYFPNFLVSILYYNPHYPNKKFPPF